MDQHHGTTLQASIFSTAQDLASYAFSIYMIASSEPGSLRLGPGKAHPECEPELCISNRGKSLAYKPQ